MMIHCSEADIDIFDSDCQCMSFPPVQPSLFLTSSSSRQEHWRTVNSTWQYILLHCNVWSYIYFFIRCRLYGCCISIYKQYRRQNQSITYVNIWNVTIPVNYHMNVSYFLINCQLYCVSNVCYKKWAALLKNSPLSPN